MNAIAGTLGLTTDYRESDFAKIIPSIQGGTYNVGMSSFTDTKEREESVDFVTYFSAGIQWAQRPGSGIDPNNACGKKVAVQATTTEETEELPAKSKACTDAGKPPIEIISFDGQDAATNAVVLGQADAMSADSPVTAYAIKQNNGKLEAAGEVFDSAPYGWPVQKGSPLAQSLQQALEHLIESGKYEEIAKNWGVESRNDRQAGDQRRGELAEKAPNMTDVDTSPPTAPAAIDAVPLRHPWRWVAAVVIIVLVVLFLYGAATNDAYRWNVYTEYLFNERVLRVGLLNTLQLTVYSMVLAIVLGVILAVMRLSANPIFKAVSWVYLWIFRGTPIYVQLVFWGLIPTIYQNIGSECRSGRRFSDSTCRCCPFRSCWRSSVWPSTRPRTWPRSSAPESVPCRRDSSKRRPHWACRGEWRCGARSYLRRCG